MYVMNRFYNDSSVELCFFCGTCHGLTREHVLPKWSFGSDPDMAFNTTANGLSHKHISATIPACGTCNSIYLSAVEDYLKDSLESVDFQYFDKNDLDVIIWWLQCIGFKLQVFDMRKKFIKHADKPFTKDISEKPLALFRQGGEVCEDHTYLQIDLSRLELTKKIKAKKRNSLIVFKTTNKNNHFFHMVDEFIFIEIPRVGYAFFLFFNWDFSTEKEAREQCGIIMDKFYN